MEELLNYYSNLLIVQYNGKPKAKATIEMLVSLMFANLILIQIQDAFNWQTAIGNQLDIIGRWVGVSRFYNGQLFYFHPWFSFPGWDDSPDDLQGGYSNFNDFEQLEGGFLSYGEILPTQNRLSDEGFGLMIGLKIIKNSINHTAKNIDDAIWEYFKGAVYTSWQDMTLTYHFLPEYREVIQVAQFKNVLPCPTGIKLELKEIV